MRISDSVDARTPQGDALGGGRVCYEIVFGTPTNDAKSGKL